MEVAFNLPAYLRRVGVDAAPHVNLATLRVLHRSHMDAIPFENLDIQMGGAVRLDPETLQAKMVNRRRGGYCFEQNALFALALGAVGFEPLTCEARVRQGAAGAIRPRTHMVLLVPCDGRDWVADVGFGGDGPIEPMALDGEVLEQAGRPMRVGREGRLHVLQQQQRGDEWQDLYAFLPEPVHAIDFDVANWFTSTYPDSPFVKNLTAQRTTGEARHILRNLTYTIARGCALETRQIARTELASLLRETFGLDVADEMRFRALDL